ncbi:2-hydroxyacid dehydrogenase [Lacrimispora sp. 210928-DFI.3.58]|uniref:2-hydroxyacid dehydrogenase n=1 Tax=Lacrimispora sp. 210928-DFI.3.58 TaxID=2883214 RepID=UPI0015B69CB2|nr:2-hydroxyacid dehydrogenase [Lacrimispora sp. 210928-DFI.3.58]MCB7319711.1 2-hydroxyacid dehydrogenase [Lacrimispora sp. 210928-DFI.3.58]
MKLLVIGRPGRLEKYSPDTELYRNTEVVRVMPGTPDEEILKVAADAEMILVDAMSGVSRTVMEGMPNLKIIHSEGVGFNFIDVEAAKEKHIYVCNCKGMNALAVAEQAILLMLGLLRQVCYGDRSVREGSQIEVKEGYMKAGSLKEIGDCTVGLLGFGDIAKETARLLKAFGAKTYYYDIFRASEEKEKEYGAEYKPMDELLAVSDIVSLHLPVTPQTANMVGKEFLDKMKQGAYLVNTSRGELVDSAALAEAVKSGKLAGAGLDTIAGEPVQKDNELLQAMGEGADKFILSCHIGGITASSFRRGYEMVWSDFAKVAAGEKPEHIVNPW